MLKLNSYLDMILIISLFIVGIASESEADFQQVKNRRGGTSGLFAFPRVGRSDPNTWEIPVSYEEYDDNSRMELKRAGLVPFPRVGRTDSQLRKWAKLAAIQQQIERNSENLNNGDGGGGGSLWSGSHIGKIQKRNTKSLSNDNF